MTLIAVFDLESNGLLEAKRERNGDITPPMDRIHIVTLIEIDERFRELGRFCGCDHEWYVPPAGWQRMSIKDCLFRLEKADIRVAHNGQGFDEAAVPLIYPWFTPKPGSKIIDTLHWSRLLFPDIAKSGPNGHKVGGNMRVQHGLKPWGLRLGEAKGDYHGGWAEFNQEMGDYGCQDTVVLLKLFRYLYAQKPNPQASQLEHDFAAIIRRQEARGFAFNHAKALELLATLQSRLTELEANLIEEFGSWWNYGKAAGQSNTGTAQEPEFYGEDEDADDPEEQEKRRAQWLKREEYADVVIPLATRRTKMLGFPDITVPKVSEKTGKALKPYIGPPLIEYTQGHPYTPIKRVQFNPSSRSHIRKRLITKYGWEPTKFTKGGKNSPPAPVVDDDVLQSLPYPEAKRLAEYYLVLKRIGSLAAGKKAWLKVAKEYPQPNGKSVWRIHGRVNTMGAATFRCTHADPNLAQVPANHAGEMEYPAQEYLWGSSCRDLFIAAPGYDLVGFDADALELRMEAHYVWPWDKGAYAKTVDEGVKSERTDPHSFTCLTIGENIMGPVSGAGRDRAKTVKYADLYGCGDEKRGSIVLPHGSRSEKIEMGKLIKEKLEQGFTAEASLKKRLVTVVEEKGSLIGLDGRTLRVRKAHAALNTLLQSAGAIVMKKALVLLDKALAAEGLRHGRDYEFVANVHDEAQAEVLPQYVELYERLALEAVAEAGRQLNLKCPLKAGAAHGRSWKATH